MAFKTRIAALTFAAAAALPLSAGAEGLTCSGTPEPVTVISPGTAEAGIACEAAAAAIRQLGACGLAQTAPITIEITSGPIKGKPDCLGVFQCEENRITLLDLKGLTRALRPDHPLLSITAERFLASLVTHEMTHALLYQTRGRRGDTVAEDEYVAYAMQLASLSEADRERLLAAYPLNPNQITTQMLNDLVLTFSPMVFGALAWRHFDAPENGCAFVEDIIAGKVDFSIRTEPCDDPDGCDDKRRP